MKSQSKPIEYIVRALPDGTYRCSCPHFVFRGVYCKHIKKIKNEKSART